MGDRINSGERLYPGNSKTSQNGNYTLIFQEDSNFVLYKKDGDNQTPIWASETYDGDNSATNKSVVMQEDGNFVMYNGDGQAIWASSTSNYEGMQTPYVLVQDDGNVVLYDENVQGQAFWNTGTYQS